MTQEGGRTHFRNISMPSYLHKKKSVKETKIHIIHDNTLYPVQSHASHYGHSSQDQLSLKDSKYIYIYISKLVNRNFPYDFDCQNKTIIKTNQTIVINT